MGCALAIWLALVALGCSSDDPLPDAGTPDGGNDAQTDDFVIDPPAPPAPAVSVTLRDWACPEGFATTPIDGDVRACAAFDPAECSEAMADFPGPEGCTTVSPSCAPPADADVRVTAGGDLDAAIAGAPAGAVIALGEGSFTLTTSVAKSITIAGACAARSTLATIAVSAGDVTLRDLSIPNGIALTGGTLHAERLLTGGLEAGGRSMAVLSRVAMLDTTIGVAVHDGANVTISDSVVRGARAADGTGIDLFALDSGTLTLRRVAIREIEGNGLVVFGGRLVLEDVHIADVTTPRGVLAGPGLVAVGGAVQATRLRIERVRISGVQAIDASLAIEDFFIDDVSTPAGAPPGAVGVLVGGNGRNSSLRRGVVSRFGAHGVFVDGASLDVEDLVVRDARGDPGREPQGAFIYAREATGHIERVSLETFGIGLGVLREATVTAEDVTLRGSRLRSDTPYDGRGINVILGSSLTAARVHVEGHREVAISVTQAHADVEDLTVIDTEIDDAAPLTRMGGVFFQLGATGTVARARLETPRQICLTVQQADTDVTIEDFACDGPRPTELERALGRGVHLVEQAHVVMTRASFTRTFDLGLIVTAGATLEGSHIAFAPGEWGIERAGQGIDVESGSRVSLDVVELEGCTGLAAAVYEPESQLVLSHARVSGTRSFCESGCEPRELGFGVGSYAGGTLTLDDFEIARSAVCGVAFDGESTVRMTAGQVVDNAIGVCAHSGGLEPEIATEVIFRNEQNSQSTELPVPEPTTAGLATLAD